MEQAKAGGRAAIAYVAHACGGSTVGEIEERGGELRGELLDGNGTVGEAAVVVGRGWIADCAIEIAVIGEAVAVDDDGGV